MPLSAESMAPGSTTNGCDGSNAGAGAAAGWDGAFFAGPAAPVVMTNKPAMPARIPLVHIVALPRSVSRRTAHTPRRRECHVVDPQVLVVDRIPVALETDVQAVEARRREPA